MAIVIDNARRADPARPGRRFEVEIECLSSGTAIPGQMAGMRPGVHVIKVHETDLPLLESMKETQWEYVQQAQDWNKGAYREHLIRNSKQAAEDVDAYIEGTLVDKDIHTAIKRARFDYTGSWEAEFYEMMRRVEGKPRGRRPLKSVTVLAPCEPEMDTQQKGMLDMISQLKEVLAPPSHDPELVETVQELKAELAALKAKPEPARKRKGKSTD